MFAARQSHACLLKFRRVSLKPLFSRRSTWSMLKIATLQTNALSVSAPLGRCGLCWPIPAARRIASIHLVRELDEEDHSVCLNLKSSWGHKHFDPAIRVPSKRRSQQMRLNRRGIRSGKERRHSRNGVKLRSLGRPGNGNSGANVGGNNPGGRFYRSCNARVRDNQLRIERRSRASIVV